MKMKKKTVPVKGRTRAALRRELQKSIEAARKSRLQRKSCVIIPRTVEMVDQDNEDWRSEKSRMIFMIAIGLTPKADWKDAVPPSLTVEEHFPNQRSSSSSTGTTETSAEAEEDDDCICLGVFNFTPIQWNPKINVRKYRDREI